MTIFTTYNQIRNLHSAIYPLPKGILDFLEFKFETEQDYSDWVFQWKAYEKELVKAIRFFRKLKNEMKMPDNVEKDQRKLEHYWAQKQYLGTVARRFYDKRIENKEKFKEKLNDPNFQRINKFIFQKEMKNVA